jgi:hypothetical protein
MGRNITRDHRAMLSTSRLLHRSALLAAAIALPLVGGAAFAQTAPTVPAADKTVAADATAAAKPADKQPGALKATPAEKKAAHDKLTAAGQTAPKGGAKAASVVKHGPTVNSSATGDAAAKPTAPAQ